MYLDLSKTFNSIDRKVMLTKPKMCGIRGRVNDLIRSYFTGRTLQVIETNFQGITVLSDISIIQQTWV